jgi:hypothetical protein
MGDAAYYEPTGRKFDFNHADDADKAFLAAVPRPIHRGDRLFTCAALVNGEPSGVEVQIKRSSAGNWFSAHWPGEGHECHHDAEAESIEHVRQKEYWYDAASSAGLPVTMELPLTGSKHRLDVAIDGAVKTDIEIQHSPTGAPQITMRTNIYAAAGWMPVWFHDGPYRPKWLRTVAYLGSSYRSWETGMPRRGTVNATGLGVVAEVRCDVAEFGGRCPANPRLHRSCGRYHPSVRGGVTRPVEQVAEMLAAGELVPLREWNGSVIVVRAAGFHRWQEMTDGGGRWLPVPADAEVPRQAGPPQIGVCTADHPAAVAAAAVLTRGHADTAALAHAAPEPCRVCGLPMDAVLYRLGDRTHPNCG